VKWLDVNRTPEIIIEKGRRRSIEKFEKLNNGGCSVTAGV